jgi:hypothetical protein
MRPLFVSFKPADAFSYSYLLGLYLGDGYLSVRQAGVATLMITCSTDYPGLVDDCRTAIQLVVPDCRVVQYPTQSQCVRVVASSRTWSDAFPQHGPGRKHDRSIALEPWQRDIVDAFPREFVRGLIHSDGCRTVNRFKTKLPSGRVAEYSYPRYFFSNLSGDIRGLFCEYCERLGIRWTQSNHRNISVSHRRSVALLDEFVGPKR